MKLPAAPGTRFEGPGRRVLWRQTQAAASICFHPASSPTPGGSDMRADDWLQEPAAPVVRSLRADAIAARRNRQTLGLLPSRRIISQVQTLPSAERPGGSPGRILAAQRRLLEHPGP